ncbi:hypothetical protein DL766_008931 [Monosporascus sp. MC13-8B]|uniref:Aromatic prenyltransferase n=1 Tax=Monosporascus cannonballus TaxID=155416 RepID=A0ABY0H6K1_9PEZI|nr:hypothetical protein DL762_004842 [Monosporascus cannonballus]RYO93016.1 hypothetical protein DL763_004516 [Monosporascus cannonballus]RYP17323.1 hypothetical protein DL766_008931 [Monosporascus sp. MC13-8B]
MKALTTKFQVQATPPLKVWQSLKKCLPSPNNKDVEFWWRLTGYHLAVMIDAAGYSTEKQYETLFFHYHWIAQRQSLDGRPVFKSLIAYDGSPLEYSWKWNTIGGEPDIRYSWEAINDTSGTAVDPLNHDPTLEYMEKVPSVLPGTDFIWYRHFLAELYNPDRSVYAKELEQGDPPATTLMHAVEYNKNTSFGLKSYFLPRKLFQGGDPATFFKSVREIMAMGGLRDVSESSLQDLRSLILTVLGLPGDYPEDAEIPVEANGGNAWPDFEALCEGFVYFFDIAPTSSKPDVKFYLTTRKYGADDTTIVRNLVAWIYAHGCGAYCDAYLGMLEKLAKHRGLKNGKGMHAYINYQCTEKGEPDVKSYISPELYHRARYAAV